MKLTVIFGDAITSLEIADDMELENFLALCKIEFTDIADIPLNKLMITCHGQQIDSISPALLKKQIQELHFKNEDAIKIDVLPSSMVHAASSNSSVFPMPIQRNANATALISNLVQGIKLPKRPTADARDRLLSDNIFAALSDPARLDYMRAEHPELVTAYESNPNDKEAFYQAFKNFKEEMARRARLMQDETSEEGQRYVAEMIQRQNIEFMHQFAMEHMPEAFVPVQMLYIRMKINNHPVIAFIDSGAQTSILSESCAKRCNVLRFVDKRFRVQAIGIGGSQKMLGRIHSCQVQVNDHVFPCPFEVMSDRDIDILFGLNTLLRHKCCIDLQKMVLRFGDGTEAPFLREKELEQEKRAVQQDETASTKTATEKFQTENGSNSEKS